MKICTKCWTRHRLNRRALKLFQLIEKEELCDLCEGLMKVAATLVDKALNEILGYEFSTANIGLIVPSHVLEREDEIRALTKERTAPSIKRYFAISIINHIERKLQRTIKLVRVNPDIFLLVDLVHRTIKVISRPLYAFGRYVKEKRGLPLRIIGNYANYRPSIEKILEELFKEYFLAEHVKFTWVGGEDKQSLVLGSGRPFITKIISPRKRTISESFRIEANEHLKPFGISLSEFYLLKGKPRQPLRYSFMAEILCSTSIEAGELSSFIPRIPTLKSVDVTFESSYGVNKKRTLLFLGDFKSEDANIRMKGIFEGGFDIKAFFGGESGRKAIPTATQLLGLPLRLINYDILEVNVL